MIIKKTIVIMYQKAYEQMAMELKANIEKSHNEYYIVAISDEQYIASETKQTVSKIKRFLMGRNAFLYSLFEKKNEKKANRRAKKQKKTLQKENEIIENTVDNGVEIKKSQKLLNNYLNYVFNIYYRFTPESFLCLSPTALAMCCKARKILKVNYDVISAIYDFGLSGDFVHFECDKYLVSNDLVKEQLEKYGIDEDRIIVTGLFPHDKEIGNKDDLIKALKIDNDYNVVLLSGGDRCSNLLLKTFKDILPITEHVNLIVYTGEDRKASKFIRMLNNIDNDNTRLDGVETGYVKTRKSDEKLERIDYYRNNIYFVSKNSELSKLETMCDMIISTPNIINIYKALRALKPMVLVAPVTKRDHNNIDYLTMYNLAIAVEKNSNILDTLNSIDSEKMQLIKDNISSTQTQNDILALEEGSNA